ncbi:MAG TPA: class I SAM-dependent methyltransferase [Dehalococcoidia bacterium]|nr:class I SAM-dependent methyltransferase [Dehalococcoidia bacterium]
MDKEKPPPIFNFVYDTYDNMLTFKRPVERLVDNAKLTKGQRVLDVACGTGWATIEAAKVVGVGGKVVGVDIADKMLDIASKKTHSTGLRNVEYVMGDAEALELDDAYFDAVLCSLSIFFLRDIPRALQEWHRVLKVGGMLAFSSFGLEFMQPFAKLFFEGLSRYDGQPSPSQGIAIKTDTPEDCQILLENAGFIDISIATEQLGFYLSDLSDYWKEVSSGAARLRLDRLSPADLEKFRAEHLSEVEPLRTDQGIWIDVPVIYSVAKK